jgi:hypothetical protein
MNTDGKVPIKNLTWYKDLRSLVLSARVEFETLMAKEVLQRIPIDVLNSLDQKDLFEIIKRDYEDDTLKPHRFFATDAIIAQNILLLLSPLVADFLIEEYRSIFAKLNLINFLEELKAEKKKRLAIQSFVSKYFS